MALPMSANERKRVKVYELRENDWFDRGTGFCTAHFIHEEARIFVESEEEPDRALLDLKIRRQDSYQKQQETLIVWTDQNGMDMAMSFQEAEGCGSVWNSISGVQHNFQEGADEFVTAQCGLPTQELGNLEQIEDVIRRAGSSQAGRDSMAKLMLHENYLAGLTRLVEVAEDLEDLQDLHRLCNIMKNLVLFNDNSMMEYMLSDDIILGVLGALEYDPDFPCHKANHRQYLSDESKFKEVVHIQDPAIRKRIHLVYRLQYLKDVVLARILDDPTFGVLNSLIFFHQVEVVQYIQGNLPFLTELFSLIDCPEADPQRKKDAVLLLQQSCAIAKNLHLPVKISMYQNFISCGLFSTINFALQHRDSSIRVAGTDILVAGIDHDAPMMRHHIIRTSNDRMRIGAGDRTSPVDENTITKPNNEKTKPMTDTLIDLLLVETDFGVKAQIGDAIKVLLDPHANNPPGDNRPIGPNMENNLQFRRGDPASQAQMDNFIDQFYNHSAKKLFQPLMELENRPNLDNLTLHEITTLPIIVEILIFFMRQHKRQASFFVLTELLHSRILHLMTCPEKPIKLSAIKWLRACIGINDEYHNRYIMQRRLFAPILDLVIATMPRDTLLNSACLEMFEFIRREQVKTKALLLHIVETYPERVEKLKHIDVFQGLLTRYEQFLNPPATEEHSQELNSSLMTSEANTPNTRHITINGGGTRWQGLKDTDAVEESYFDTDDDDEDELARDTPASLPNGWIPSNSPIGKPLVDYADDEEEEDEISSPMRPAASNLSSDTLAVENNTPDSSPTLPSTHSSTSPPTPPTSTAVKPPPSIAEKRRRQDEDDEDELGKLSTSAKRRNSSNNLAHTGLSFSFGHSASISHGLRRDPAQLIGTPDALETDGNAEAPNVAKSQVSPNGIAVPQPSKIASTDDPPPAPPQSQVRTRAAARRNSLGTAKDIADPKAKAGSGPKISIKLGDKKSGGVGGVSSETTPGSGG